MSLKPKRRDLSFVEKHKILNAYKVLPRCSQRQAAIKLGVSQSLLNRLINQNKLSQLIPCEPNNLDRKRKRGGKSKPVEEALFRWYTSLRDNPISTSMLLEKAKLIANDLDEVNFVATSGWLGRWKKRHNITDTKIYNESSGAATQSFVEVKIEESKAETDNSEKLSYLTQWRNMAIHKHDNVNANINYEEKSEDEQVHYNIVPNPSEIRESLDILQTTLEFKGGNKDDLKLFYNLKKRVEHLMEKELKQQTLEWFYENK